MKIDHFRGEYAFLSNFWEVPVTYKGLTYGSNEAAFQAQKCMTEEEKIEFIEKELLSSLLGKAHFSYCKWLLDTCIRSLKRKRMYKKAVVFETEFMEEFKRYYFS